MADPLKATAFSASDLLNIPPRPRRRDAPVEHDRTAVHVRGERLHDIWWQGRQWAVTAYGLECRDGTYVVPADQLARGMGSAEGDAFLIHVSRKIWVDTDDLI